MLSLFKDNVRSSLPSLVVAALAVGLAWLGVRVGHGWSVGVAVLILLVGLLNQTVGDRQLRRDRAKVGIRWLQWAILGPGAIAAAAGALVIVVGIQLAPAENASEETKALLGAAAAAISTYFTTVFVKGADDADEGWVGSLVKARLQDVFKDRFEAGSAARDAVFSDDRYGGWGRDARNKRADVIQDALAEK